ncbi:MAG: hypothetical protein C0404_11245 [Verrucomicrobia bacterium]|nr:hypothetical protein [Verrucomicrobiota bacterium]
MRSYGPNCDVLSQVKDTGSNYYYMSRRVQKTGGITTNTSIWDGWLLTSELSNSTTNYYYYMSGLDLSGSLQDAASSPDGFAGHAGGIGGLLSVTRNGATCYTVCDGTWNITEYADAGSNVMAHRQFDAYGNTPVATGSMVNDFHFWFSAKYLDPETGLYYYGYRYLDTVSGRWLGRDPICETGGKNLFGMCGNDPIDEKDVFGLTNDLIGPSGEHFDLNERSVANSVLWGGSMSWLLTIQGKQAFRIGATEFWMTISDKVAYNDGVWFPKPGSIAPSDVHEQVLYIYRKDAPHKVFKLNYGKITETANLNPGKTGYHVNYQQISKVLRMTEVPGMADHYMAPSVTALGRTLTLFKYGGRAMFVLGSVASGVEIYVAQDKWRAVAGESSGVLGSAGGFFIGSEIGMWVGGFGGPYLFLTVPAGYFIGGAIGAGIGYFGGREMGYFVYEKIYEPLEKEEWEIIECQDAFLLPD